MANLFAFRATEPSDMKCAKDPVGSENDIWLQRLAEDAAIVVAAWGNHGDYMGRSKAVIKLLPGLFCLTMNKTGEPAHPLYQKADRKPMLISQCPGK